MKLDRIAADVLYLLWRRRRNKDGSLVPATVLHEELLRGEAGTQYTKDDLKVQAVKKRLAALREAGLVEYDALTKRDAKPGPAPNGYRLSADPPIITWRATAAVAMLLHNHPDRRLRRETIAKEARRLGLTHHDRNWRLSPQEISGLLDYCIRKGYIKEEEMVIDEVTTPKTEKRMITTSRVEDEGLFLRKLAEEVKRQAASEQSSSGPAEGNLQNRS